MSTREKSREKRQNAAKTSGEISYWKCSLMALNGLRTNRHCRVRVYAFVGQPLSKQLYICWPVFSSVDRRKNTVFSQCVTSALFLGNMSRARKHRFALCLRVPSNQYVDRSSYANVFKFSRETELFERGKLNSRCFHWFPAAMFESLRRAPTWRLNTKHYIFQ